MFSLNSLKSFLTKEKKEIPNDFEEVTENIKNYIAKNNLSVSFLTDESKVLNFLGKNKKWSWFEKKLWSLSPRYTVLFHDENNRIELAFCNSLDWINTNAINALKAIEEY